MSVYKKEIIIDKFLELPEKIKDFTFNTKTTVNLNIIGKKLGFPQKEIVKISEETGYLLIGLTPPSDFVNRLKGVLSTNSKKIEDLTRVLIIELFKPIKKELSDLYPDFDKELMGGLEKIKEAVPKPELEIREKERVIKEPEIKIEEPLKPVKEKAEIEPPIFPKMEGMKIPMPAPRSPVPPLKKIEPKEKVVEIKKPEFKEELVEEVHATEFKKEEKRKILEKPIIFPEKLAELEKEEKPPTSYKEVDPYREPIE